MKKIIVLLTILVITTAMFAGCAKKEEATTETTTTTEATTTETATTETATEEAVDAVTTASIVDNVDALINALSANGTWIAAALNDMSTDKEIVVEGAFTNKDLPARKLALYTQDDNRNITASFTLTAPKLTVKSENFRIHGGTFVGDVYVEANGFELAKTAKVTGNVYFASQEYMDSAIFDETSSVSGVKEVATVDVVTTASIVDNVDALINALSANGTWIAAALNDMSTDKEIVVEGAFTNKDLPARKLALYTQDDNRNITASFTLTAPKLTVKSENFRIHGGTFVGDVYVEANGFELAKTAKVTGNVYFASQEYMDSAIFDETSSVSGVKEVK